MKEVSSVQGITYIYYISTNGTRNIITIYEDEVIDKVSYDANTGVLYQYSSSNNEITVQQIDLQVPDNMFTEDEITQIESLLNSENGLEEIAKLPNVNIEYLGNGIPCISKINSDSIPSLSNYASSEETVSDVEARFEQCCDEFPAGLWNIDSTSRFSGYTGEYHDVNVYVERDNYTIVNPDTESFTVGTAIGTISAIIGMNPVSLVSWLSLIGVLVTFNEIQCGVDLCTGMTVSYTANEYGVVYDSVTNHTDVVARLITRPGRYNGGFDGDGEFVWNMQNGYSPDFLLNNYDPETFSILTMSYYDAELIDNGYCSFPEF